MVFTEKRSSGMEPKPQLQQGQTEQNACGCAQGQGKRQRASERPHRNNLQQFNYSIWEEEKERADQRE